MSWRSISAAAPAALALLAFSAPARAMDAVSLRCEYHESPVGVDALHPRLSWELTSLGRAQKQSAYHILVASTSALLARGAGDLWDTGKVASDATIQIPYAGKPLVSNQECFWKVRVWDRDGHSVGWSRPTSWAGRGLLNRADWRAQWIGADIPREKMEDRTYLPSPYMRKTFDTTKRVRRAVVYATAAGLYELYLDGKRVGNRYLTPGWTEYSKRLYYQAYDVSGRMASPGHHVIGAILGDGWYGLHHNGRGRLALLAQMLLEYEDGTSELVATDGTWKTTYNGPIRSDDLYNGETYDARRELPGWETTRYDDNTWLPVRAGLGDASMSGFVDVTDKLRAAFTGDPDSFVVSNEALGGDPAYGFVKVLKVQYRQGGQTKRVELPEGGKFHFTGAGAVTIVKASYGADEASANIADAVLQWHPGSPVRETEELHPTRLTEPKPGVYVFDLSQNFAGWARLKIRGKRDQKITLRFAEMLNPDGSIYTRNLRGAKCTDTYICRGGSMGVEEWEPRFTFHGFRYVELTGLTEKPALSAVTGVVLQSDAPRTSEFTSSNPLLNRLYQNIVWGQRSNYLEVPTDCPQRDERMGWSGDAQVFIGTGSYNEDVAPFFTAWLRTFNDSQDAQGGYPNVSPKGGGVSPAWGDAGIICPWTLHRMYGDTEVIREHWDGMVRWMDYLQKRSKDLIRPAEGFGDWLSLGANTPREVISTAYFAYDARLMSEMAEATGKREEAAKYERLFQDIRTAFNQAFVQVTADGSLRIKGDTQTDYLLALGFDLLPAEQQHAANDRLVALIAERQNHISIGFLGVNLLLPVLTRGGHPELAWTLMDTSTYPSWLYAVTQGATTVWERWDGWTQDKGFQDPGMNSFNHYAYGSCGQWMFSSAAGIDTDGPAFHHIRIRPAVTAQTNHVAAAYDSIRGRIATDWTLAPDGFDLDVTIPANTTATVSVPTADPRNVTEGGKPAPTAEGVRYVGMENSAAVYEIGSGHYHFRAAPGGAQAIR